MAYRPPHRRDLAPMAERADSDSRSNSKGSPRGGQPSSSTPPTHGRRQGIRPDNRAVQGTMLENEGRGSTRPVRPGGPGGPGLVRPGGPGPVRPGGIRADGLRPSRKSTPLDEMEMLASVSRSGGDADGDRLKDHDVQLRFRTYIEAKIERCSVGSDTDSLNTVVRLFRKLREGVVASGRIDAFAVEVFEDSVRYAVFAHDGPQLNAALHGLVGMYASTKRNPKYAPLLLVYHLVHSPRGEYQRALETMTLPPKPLRVERVDISLSSLSLEPNSNPNTHTIAAPHVATTLDLRFVMDAARALADETFDPLAFAALIHNKSETEGLERTLLAWAAPAVRERAAARLRRAYVTVSISWAGRILNLPTEGVESWAAAHGLDIVDGVVKLR